MKLGARRTGTRAEPAGSHRQVGVVSSMDLGTRERGARVKGGGLLTLGPQAEASSSPKQRATSWILGSRRPSRLELPSVPKSWGEVREES